MIGHIETACFHYSGGCEMIFASNREAEWIRTTPDIRECYGKLFDKESGSSVVMLSPAKNGIILTISKMIPNRYGDNLTAYLYIPNALDISGEALQGIVFDVISSLAHNRRDAVGSCLSSISNSEYEQLSPVDFEQATTNSYSIRKGTFMEGSNIPLTDWFIAAYLMTSSKNGINTTQLRVYLDVSKKTAWFMLQRIRQAFVQNPTEKFDGVVEVDETYVGGKNKNRHRNKKVKHSQGRSTKDKAPVFGILQRDGKVFVKVVKNVGWKVLTGNMLRKIKAGSTIYSDEYSAYQRVFGKAKAFTHKIVVHGKGNYVNGDVHTNNIEGFWNITKDAVCGTYNHVSRKYLQRYCDEVSFRFNNRKVSKGESFCDLFANCMGTRITYKQLVTS